MRWCLLLFVLFVSACSGEDGEATPVDLQDAAPDVAPAGAAAGEPCAEDSDCEDGTCLTEGFPAGYCSAGCDACPDGTACAGSADDAFCAVTCESPCRDGYLCQRTVGASVCLPAPTEGVDGGPCASDEDCAGGDCMQPPRWPAGYCTSRCNTSSDCNGGARNGLGARCLDNPLEDDFCVQGCLDAEDCRRGYICQDVGGTGICVGNPDPEELSDEDIAAHPMDIQCDAAGDGENRISYEIADDTFSYMFVPFTPDGRALVPKYIDMPTGELDFEDEANAFQAFNARLHDFMNATVIPATEALSRQKVAGAHRYSLTTDSDRICHYLLETKGPGSVLDLNVFVVGVPDVDANNAGDNEHIEKVFARVDTVFALAGIRLGKVRFIEPPQEVQDSYSVVRSDSAANALTELLPRPGDTLDQVLSVNVVLVNTFAVPDQDELLGQAQGLPGPAGLHGTTASGVIVSAEFLGEAYRTERGFLIGNDFIGDTMAHEIGHYLGLLHTTETTQAHFDPLEDTPMCDTGVMPDDCEDRLNLMFPLADNRERTVSEGQAWMLQANPLVKEAE